MVLHVWLPLVRISVELDSVDSAVTDIAVSCALLFHFTVSLPAPPSIVSDRDVPGANPEATVITSPRGASLHCDQIT